jgi:hypothetical protein
MVTILKENTRGNRLGEQFANAITSGAERGMKFAEELALERDKAQQEFELFQKYFGDKVGVAPSPTEGMGEQLQQTGQTAQSTQKEPEETALSKAWKIKKYPEVMKAQQEEKKTDRKKFEADRTYHTNRSSKFLDSIDATANGIPEREIALKSAESGIKSGQMSPLGGDFWAAITGINAFKSASGAQLESAAKVNLIGSLERLGARPNQFIEKVSNSAFAQAGESEEAQTAKILLAKSVLDLDKEKIRLTHQIANEDREKHGFVKEDVSSRVDKALQPIAKERMNELAFSLQQNIESDIGIPNLSKNATKPVMKGTYLTPEMANVLKNALISAGKPEDDLNKMAIRLGYDIPSSEFLEKMGYIKE